jgi:glucan biosynthesis protein
LDRITDLPDSGYTSYFKEICKSAKYGRYARGLEVYVTDETSYRNFGEYERKFILMGSDDGV